MAIAFPFIEGYENLGSIRPVAQCSMYKVRRADGQIAVIILVPSDTDVENDIDFKVFQNEVSKLQQLSEETHSNLLKITGSGRIDVDQRFFIETEFIEGPDLLELLNPPNAPIFSIEEVIKVAHHLSRAIAHFHKSEIIHGRIHTRSVQFDKGSDNYVLIDLAKAIMDGKLGIQKVSERTEFIAPEQYKGHSYFASDIYSFGIIMMEILSGKVYPTFLEKQDSQSAFEADEFSFTEHQNLLDRRQQNMPKDWDEIKVEREMQVPEWLLRLINCCSEKSMGNRFKDGIQLHDYFLHHFSKYINDSTKEKVSGHLSEPLSSANYSNIIEQPLSQIYHLGSSNVSSEAIEDEKIKEKGSPVKVTGKLQPLKLTLREILVFVFIMLFSCAVLFTFLKIRDANKRTERIIGVYKIIAPKAYFYNEPKLSKKRQDFLRPSDEKIVIYERKGDFLLAEIEQENGDLLIGWLNKKDVMTLSEWSKEQKKETSKPELIAQTTSQLIMAKQLLDNGNPTEALVIYSALSTKEVPEAMFYYGLLALQSRNKNIGCNDALNLLKRSSEKGYAQAKRTLGLVYAFADDIAFLKKQSISSQCKFEYDKSIGSMLLMEAMLQGDAQSGKWLEILKRKK